MKVSHKVFFSRRPLLLSLLSASLPLSLSLPLLLSIHNSAAALRLSPAVTEWAKREKRTKMAGRFFCFASRTPSFPAFASLSGSLDRACSTLFTLSLRPL